MKLRPLSGYTADETFAIQVDMQILAKYAR